MTEQLEFESAGSRERAMSSHGENGEALAMYGTVHPNFSLAELPIPTFAGVNCAK